MKIKRTSFFYLTLLVILLFGLYFHTFDNGFHLDDTARIVDNPHIRQVQPIGRFFTDPRTSTSQVTILEYRPLLPLSLAINYAVFGLELPSYHIFSLLCLIGILGLLYAVLPYVLPTLSKKERFFCVLLMGVHPISSITVNYVVLRDLLMMLLFSSASFLFFCKYIEKKTPLSLMFSCLFFAIALPAKQNGILLPGILLFYLFFIKKFPLFTKKTILPLLPFAAIGLGFIYLTSTFNINYVGRTESALSLTHFYTVLKVHTFRYLTNIIFPLRMGAYPYISPETTLFNIKSLLSFALMLSTVIFAWRVRKQHAIIPFVIFTYWLTILPANSFIKLNHLAADYRPFWGLLFLLMAVGYGINRYAKEDYKNRIWIALIIYFTLFNVYQTRFWQTEETLWMQSIKEGASVLGYGSAAVAVRDRDPELAISLLKEALVNNPTNATVHINLAVILYNQGRINEAGDYLKRLLELQPNSPQTYYWIARHIYLTGNKEAAYQTAKKILQFPTAASVKELYLLANIAYETGHNDIAKLALNMIHQKVDYFDESRDLDKKLILKNSSNN